MLCPKCCTHHCVKAGIVRKKQRYKCKTCKYFFTDPAHYNGGYPCKIKQQAIAMVLDGNGIRQAARHVKASHVSILNWIKQSAQQIKEKPVEKAQVVEIDEIWHYLQKKE